ncbi:hypothetical protein EDD27_3590 [Nonomuraea polychroma]|uniref:Uncharacterized protein n=1 Tax=Nonomuraea polychroma TaxID=46176 RepID=A0A438M615_9ACTN|nr:hypothetical protein EDD27_3590 [Nonomuraea polychroma]
MKRLGYTRDDVANVDYRLPKQGQTLNELEGKTFDEFGGKKDLPHNTNNSHGYRNRC